MSEEPCGGWVHALPARQCAARGLCSASPLLGTGKLTVLSSLATLHVTHSITVRLYYNSMHALH